jgi:hypothetical protein
LRAAGLAEKDLRAPWFHLQPSRRADVRAILASL